MEPLDTEGKYPQFISNKPFGDDLFEGKSQERVAENITQIIKNDAINKVIGIDGGWGSGKSNLIEIVQKKLKTENQEVYNFFMYDAWGHQEDLQRRSLLEEITSFITLKNCDNKSIIDDDAKWKKKLKELLSKSKETEKKTIPSLSLGIIFSLLILILTPLFKSISDIVHSEYLKVLLTSFPLILLFLLFLYHYNYKTEKTNIRKLRIHEAFTKLFYLYQKSQKEDITFEKISEDEPSVKKFRDWMTEISHDLNNKKLIIVFDNMDRLPNSKILELWSSIHTFFAESNYNNIHVLVPFDRKNIKSAFASLKSTDDNYTDDFINKTFNIIYRVSPPILSDWKKFFELKWKQAFGVIDDEFVKIIQVFDHLSITKTPREIVVFINEFVATTQICRDIPLQYTALFIISKQTILDNSVVEIIKPSYLKSLSFLYADDEDLPKYIAALIYQIDPGRALAVVFTDKLTSALNSNDKEQIKIISESNFFDDILSKAIIEVSNYDNSVLALNEISDKISQKTWDDLYRKLNPTNENLQNAKFEPFQLIIFSKITYKSNFLKTTLRKFRTAINFISLDYYNSIKQVENIIKEKKINIKLDDFLLEKATKPEDFMAMIKSTNDTNTYGIICNNIDLNNYLDTINDVNELSNSGYLSKIPSKYSLVKYTASLEAKIKLYQADRKTVSAYYTAYQNISKTVLKVLLDDNYIYSHFVTVADVKDNFYFDLLSMFISKWGNFPLSYLPPFEEILNKTDQLTIVSLAQRIENFINYGDLLLKSIHYEKPLLKEVIKYLTVGAKTGQMLNIVSVITQIDNILAKTGIAPEILINRLNSWDPKTITLKEIPNILKNIEFFKYCVIIPNTLTEHCINIANDYFESLTDEQWVVEFENPNSNIVSISLLTLKNQYSAKAVSALKETIQKIAKSEIPTPNKLTWVKIIEKSNKGSFRSVIKDVRDILITSQEINRDIFLFFGDWLFEFGEMESNKDSLRRIFRKLIIEDESCIDIIMTHTENMLAIYENGEDQEDFRNEILVLIDERKLFVQPLADLLGIKPIPKE